MKKVFFGVTGGRLIAAINSIAALSIFFFGYDQGVMSGVNTSNDYKDLMGLQSNPSLLGGIVSIFYGGTLIGALIGGWLGDRIGRIKTIMISAMVAIIGAALQSSSQNVAWIMCARVVSGLGVGGLNAIVPVWSAEVSHHTSRGQMIAIEFFTNILGVVVAYWLEYGMTIAFRNGQVQAAFVWRFPLAFQIIPLILLLLGIGFFPESPRYLMKYGRNDEAMSILMALRGHDDPNHPDLQMEYQAILEVVQMEKSEGDGYFQMFKKDELNTRRRVNLAVWLQIVQELVGIGVITVYAPEVFGQAGYDPNTSQLISGINNITYMLSTLVAVFTLDKLGRRFALYWGAILQGVALILLAIFVKILPANPTAYGGAATFFVFLYTAAFGATWLTVPWLYPTEIFPLKSRCKGGSMSVVGWSIGNALVAEITPPMIAGIGWATFLIFGIINFLAIPFVWAFYPETANRTLEEMDLLFTTKSPFVWKSEKEVQELEEKHPQLAAHRASCGGQPTVQRPSFSRYRSSNSVKPNPAREKEAEATNGDVALA